MQIRQFSLPNSTPVLARNENQPGSPPEKPFLDRFEIDSERFAIGAGLGLGASMFGAVLGMREPMVAVVAGAVVGAIAASGKVEPQPVTLGHMLGNFSEGILLGIGTIGAGAMGPAGMLGATLGLGAYNALRKPN